MKEIQRSLKASDGTFGVGHFISLDQDQQEDLLSTLDAITTYIESGHQPRPLNLYIEASPGTGKSFLINCLAQSVEKITGYSVELLTFNLSQVESIGELTDLFDKVRTVSIKKSHSKTIPIVFFDECDSEISGKKIYKHLLVPMFDGEVSLRGGLHEIGDAIFFFAASTFIAKQADEDSLEVNEVILSPDIADVARHNGYVEWRNAQRSALNAYIIAARQSLLKDIPEKFIDFLDRIDEFIYLPPVDTKVSAIDYGLNIEKVADVDKFDRALQFMQLSYLAVALIKKYKNSVSLVVGEVLATAVQCLLKAKSRRDLESYIIKSATPSSGCLDLNSLPQEMVEMYYEDGKELFADYVSVFGAASHVAYVDISNPHEMDADDFQTLFLKLLKEYRYIFEI